MSNKKYQINIKSQIPNYLIFSYLVFIWYLVLGI